jgi:azurin
MKKFLIALNIVIWSYVGYQATAFAADAPETKKVCIDVQGKDGKPVKNKDGSVKQDCKTVKVHKKHEGTAVPDGKKK